MEADLLMSMSFREKVYPKVETFQLKPSVLSHTQDMSINTIPDLPPRGPPPTYVHQQQPIFLSSFERMPTPQLNVNVDEHRHEGVVYSGINHPFTAPTGGYFHWASLTFCTRTRAMEESACVKETSTEKASDHTGGERGTVETCGRTEAGCSRPELKKTRCAPRSSCEFLFLS